MREELNGKERARLDRMMIMVGNQICAFYLDKEWDGSMETLHKVFDLWRADRRCKKPSGNEMTRGLGGLNGEFLRRKHGWRWVFVISESRCDLGLIKDTTEWQFFPMHWMAKRINPKKAENIIEGIFGVFQHGCVVDNLPAEESQALRCRE